MNTKMFTVRLTENEIKKIDLISKQLMKKTGNITTKSDVIRYLLENCKSLNYGKYKEFKKVG